MPSDVSIGAQQAANTNLIVGLAERLSKVTSANFAESIQKEASVLMDWRARMAVIGQVKAGKSTFINAFIGQPGLVPADVNPWTAAVTNFYFAHPDDPTAGGVFHFFSEAEWRRLYDGNTTAREMAEELLPGFKETVLQRQILEMQDRAAKRLGRLSHYLHGKSHKFDEITPELLARYVCTGHVAEDGEKPELTGRYSDITKSADIYRPRGIFECPAVVVDTPGVNDPFLVRDELTCQNLRIADIYVVVLSVHQALSEIDQALIRMLAAQGAKEVVVFINRIDELEDAGPEIAAIQAKIRDILRAAHSGINMSIEVGSAFWGQTALLDDPVAIREALDSPAARTRAAMVDGVLPEDPRVRLFELSGIAAVRRVIDNSINESVGIRAVRASASALNGIVAASQSLMRNQISDLTVSIDQKGKTEDVATTVRDRLELRVNAFDTAARDVSELLSQIAGQLQSGCEEFGHALAAAMDGVVGGFIDEQVIELANTVRYSRSKKVWQLDTTEIQLRLQQGIKEAYTSAREDMDSVLRETIRSAGMMLSNLMPTDSIRLDATQLPNNDIAPIVPPISSVLSMELTKRHGWMFWRKSKLDEDEAIAGLKRIIQAELAPAVASLCSGTEQAMRERVDACDRRLGALLNGIVDGLAEERDAVADELDAMDAENVKSIAKVKAMRDRLTERLETAKYRLAALGEMLGQLDPFVVSSEPEAKVKAGGYLQ